MTTVRPTARSEAFIDHEAGFASVLGPSPALVRVIEIDAHEGPTYVPGEDALYVTTVPRLGPAGVSRAQVKRIGLDGERLPLEPDRITVVDADVVMPNGMTAGPDQTLIVCDQGDLAHEARLTRLDPRTGATSTIVDSWLGRRLNSPNDVAVHSDGSIWFTDPSYGYLQGFRPRPEAGDHVYRLDPLTGSLSVVADSLDKPNGIAFSPDERLLYLTDSGANQAPGSFHADRPRHLIACDVIDGRRLGIGRVIDETPSGTPDGIAVDEDGRVYVGCADGIRVLSRDGFLLGLINVPGAVNVTFGGLNHNHLFITADTAIWVAVLDTKGA